MSRRSTMLPPPPTNPDVLWACWEPSPGEWLDESELESVGPSSAPTCWQAPPTEWDELRDWRGAVVVG